MPVRSAQGAPALLKWGVAAALMLGAGVGLGRWSAPAVNMNALQTRIEASLKSSLAVELQRQVNADLQSALAGVAAKRGEAAALIGNVKPFVSQAPSLGPLQVP